MPASATPTRTDFIPVVLGGDIGSYALIREFHEAFGVKSIAMGPGFIGTIVHSKIAETHLIDAYAAGLPIIASDWHDNPNLIEEGKTGKLFPTRDVGSLAGILTEIYHNPAPFESMRKNCIEEAKRYQPDKIVRILSSHISI